MVKASDFVRQVYIPLNEGWGYIYGTWGTMWTEAKQAKATREMTVKYGSRWIGHMVTDCSGLLRWALYQLGESIVHHARYQYTDYCRNKGKLINGSREDGKPILPGTAVFLKGSEAHIHHVGVFVGDDTVIEAKGTINGVVTSHLNRWDYWGELKMVDYSEQGEEATPVDVAVKAEVTNPNHWLNVHSGPGFEYSRVFQLERGTIVDVLAQDGDWMQIRSGGRIGWAFADYLTILNPEDADTEPPEEIPVKPSVMDELQKARDDLHEVLKRIDDIIRRLN